MTSTIPQDKLIYITWNLASFFPLSCQKLANVLMFPRRCYFSVFSGKWPERCSSVHQPISVNYALSHWIQMVPDKESDCISKETLWRPGRTYM